MAIKLPADIIGNPNALFFVSHSGGKDSQAMYLHLIRSLAIPADQIIVVHAHLGKIEWEGVREHIEATTDHPLQVVQAIDRNGQVKDFLGMVRNRGMWPSPSYRQCTSDLKRGPIYKFIRAAMKSRGATVGVNCTGMRAEESSARAKRKSWSVNKALSKAGREVYEWLPLHDWTTDQVFDCIYNHGQRPFDAYGQRGEKNTRLSCVFCIMGSQNDHNNGAISRPALYAEVVNIERESGHTMFQGAGLEERNGLTVAQAWRKSGLLIPIVQI